MPYVTPERRRQLNDWTEVKAIGNAGELNYVVSSLMYDFVERKGLKYQVVAEVQAAVHGALVEFERRLVGPYEDQKVLENGDIPALTRLLASVGA